MKLLFIFLFLCSSLFANDRFGLTPEQADKRWPKLLGKTEAITTNGVAIFSRRYAVKEWQLDVFFMAGKSEALEFRKRGDGGSIVPLTETELAALLSLFGLYISSETMFAYRMHPNCRDWQGTDCVAFYDPENKVFRVVSMKGLNFFQRAQELGAQRSIQGL